VQAGESQRGGRVEVHGDPSSLWGVVQNGRTRPDGVRRSRGAGSYLMFGRLVICCWRMLLAPFVLFFLASSNVGTEPWSDDRGTPRFRGG